VATARKVSVLMGRRVSVHTPDGWTAGELELGAEFDLEKGEDPETVLLEKTRWLKELVRSQFRTAPISDGAAENGAAENGAELGAGEPAAQAAEPEIEAEDEEVEVG
jgi:hypothetical protein